MTVVTPRDHLAAVRAEIDEVTVEETIAQLASDTKPVLIDVRERDEFEQGFIPGAAFIPRGNLESRIEQVVLDREQPIIVYCAAGNRSVYATRTLNELGYTHVASMAGGFTRWKQNGHDWRVPQ